MRLGVLALGVLAMIALGAAGSGCVEHGKGGGAVCVFMGEPHAVGEQFPAGDGCNTCSCQADDVVTCSELACPVGDGGVGDGTMAACAPSGGCNDGPFCNGICCGIGERCDNGVCTCGGNPACTGDDVCASGGPVGGPTCGTICCGSAGSPCPL